MRSCHLRRVCIERCECTVLRAGSPHGLESVDVSSAQHVVLSKRNAAASQGNPMSFRRPRSHRAIKMLHADLNRRGVIEPLRLINAVKYLRAPQSFIAK
jgi:hypothetical protein